MEATEHPASPIRPGDRDDPGIDVDYSARAGGDATF